MSTAPHAPEQEPTADLSTVRGIALGPDVRPECVTDEGLILLSSLTGAELRLYLWHNGFWLFVFSCAMVVALVLPSVAIGWRIVRWAAMLGSLWLAYTKLILLNSTSAEVRKRYAAREAEREAALAAEREAARRGWTVPPRLTVQRSPAVDRDRPWRPRPRRTNGDT